MSIPIFIQVNIGYQVDIKGLSNFINKSVKKFVTKTSRRSVPVTKAFDMLLK